MSQTTAHKTPRTRSPIYPAIGLQEALSRAATLYAEADRHAAPVSVAVGYWKYKPGSSSGGQVISALKQFGLLLEEGSKDKRHSQTVSAGG